MISGFMILKDVIKTGYPFVEAIASALPICDEFLISDGFSTDGTFEVVQRISKLNRKIKVFRYNWPPKRHMSVLADVTNVLRKKCRFDYIFSIQANEIIHEESVEYIKALPEMHRGVYTFSFPYLQLLSSYRWTEEFRLRFSKNLPGIIAIDDAWTLGASKSFIKSEEFTFLKNPRKAIHYIWTGIGSTYANSGNNPFSKSVYLPKPIFRYWSLFPENFLEKCLKQEEMFNSPTREIVGILRGQLNDASSFWRLAAEMLTRNARIHGCEVGIKYPEGLEVVKEKDHPALIQDFISNSSLKRYSVREKVLDLISGL
jgi:glycosyltransferase involved in cell wall biosynthesis